MLADMWSISKMYAYRVAKATAGISAQMTSLQQNEMTKFFPRSGSRSTSLSNVTPDLGWILELIIRRAKKEFDSIRIFRDLH